MSESRFILENCEVTVTDEGIVIRPKGEWAYEKNGLSILSCDFRTTAEWNPHKLIVLNPDSALSIAIGGSLP